MLFEFASDRFEAADHDGLLRPGPGDTVISRRTSRKPLRLPVTVYLPGFKLDLTPIERSEEAHALDGDLGGVVGFERQH